MSTDLNKSANEGAKWTAVSSALTAIFSILQISIVARYLEPSEIGTVALLVVLVEICNVFVRAGLSDVLIVKTQATKAQLSALYWGNILLGAIIYLGIFFFSEWLPYFFDAPDSTEMARSMGIVVLIVACTIQLETLMRRELYFKELAIYQVAMTFFGLLTAVGLAILGYGAWALVFSNIVLQASRGILLLIFSARKGWLPGLIFSAPGLKPFLSFGAYRISTALVNNLNSRIDQLAIAAFLGAEALGFYSIAFNLAIQPFQRINPILTQISFPIFAKVKDDDERLLRGYRKGTRMLTSINAPILIGLAATAPLLLPTLLGSGWEVSVPITQVLCIAVLFRSIANTNIGLILAKGRYKWPFYWNLALVAIIPTTIVAISLVHATPLAVSWSLLFINLGLLISGYLLFARQLLGPFGAAYTSDVAKPILTAAAMGFVVHFAAQAVEWESPWLEIAMLVGIGAVIYVGLFVGLLKKHTRELFEMAKLKA